MIRLPERKPFDYQFVRDNQQWSDHRLRVRITAELIAWLKPNSVIDPACGDGSIIAAADSIYPFSSMALSDVSAPNIEKVRNSLGYHHARVRSVEDALTDYEGVADVVVLTEFLEHIEDPVAILKLARSKAKLVVASSPLWDGKTTDSNPEHLWSFDAEGYQNILTDGGWHPEVFVPLYFTSIYDFQLWVAR